MDNNAFLSACHSEWKEIVGISLEAMDQHYLNQLVGNVDWLPGPERLFAAFGLPLERAKYILLGESPYPRAASANGYAFWDESVDSLWSIKGLSVPVNRATSLRNWIKMMLVARGDLMNGTSQESIAQLDKCLLVQTAKDLFEGMMNKGILLLNASLVYSEGKVPYHARYWKPFMHALLEQLSVIRPDIQLILLGKIADMLGDTPLSVGLRAEHPYNISFINNQQVIQFFKPLDLLRYE